MRRVLGHAAHDLVRVRVRGRARVRVRVRVSPNPNPNLARELARLREVIDPLPGQQFPPGHAGGAPRPQQVPGAAVTRRQRTRQLKPTQAAPAAAAAAAAAGRRHVAEYLVDLGLGLG